MIQKVSSRRLPRPPDHGACLLAAQMYRDRPTPGVRELPHKGHSHPSKRPLSCPAAQHPPRYSLGQSSTYTNGAAETSPAVHMLHGNTNGTCWENRPGIRREDVANLWREQCGQTYGFRALLVVLRWGVTVLCTSRVDSLGSLVARRSLLLCPGESDA